MSVLTVESEAGGELRNEALVETATGMAYFKKKWVKKIVEGLEIEHDKTVGSLLILPSWAVAWSQHWD